MFGQCNAATAPLATILNSSSLYFYDANPYASETTLAAFKATLVPDTMPPVIELLGAGTLDMSSGRCVMVTEVVVGSGVYVDEGAVAWDAMTGDPTRMMNVTDTIKVRYCFDTTLGLVLLYCRICWLSKFLTYSRDRAQKGLCFNRG